MGKLALITGGGKGVGRAIAIRLAREGHRVVILGRDRKALDETAALLENDPLVIEADITNATSVDAALTALREGFGDPNILIQNAGIAESAALADTTDEIWDRTMAVNVTSAFRIARTLVPSMIEAKWGRIVHVASTAGLVGVAYTAAYCASKHALVGLTRALAAELARTGVTVNAVCPSFVETEMTERAIERIVEKTKRTPEQARAALADMNPQRRIIMPDEVAHVVAMLCSEEAMGINGCAIPIDGGQVMR